jgi:hypothetical protein
MNVQMTTDGVKYTRYIHNSSTRSHASEEEHRTRNRRPFNSVWYLIKIQIKHDAEGASLDTSTFS